MNTSYLERAKQRVPDVPLLINMVSKRVRRLVTGERPLIKPDSLSMEKMDLALKEIAEGKLTAEMVFSEEDMRQSAHSSGSGILSL